MIKFTGKTSTIAKIYREGGDPYFALIDLSDYTILGDKYYNSKNKTYILKIITTGSTVTNMSVKAIYFTKLAVSKVIRGSKVIWEIVSSCFGSGFWKDLANWSDEELWKD